MYGSVAGSDMATQSFNQDIVLRDKEEVARLNAVFDEADRRAPIGASGAMNAVTDPNEAVKLFLPGRREKPYTIVPLNDLISRIGEKNTSAGLRSFVRAQNRDAEEFLQNKAVQFERSGKARTYLAMMDGRIVGFFTVAMSCIRLPAGDVSKFTHARMNMDPESNSAPTFLIGQLGQIGHVYSGFGEDLLDDAVATVEEANGIAGCRLVRLDCYEEYTPYYEQFGFRFLRYTDPGNGRAVLDQLVRAI